MTDRARELLERTIEEWDSDRDLYEFHKVMEEIRAFLSTPEPEQDDEPVAYIRKDQLEKASRSAMLCEVSPEPRQDRVGLFLHPAPRPEFVRLSEEEIFGLVPRDYMEVIEFARAIEDTLEKKNTINKSDPDSIDLQSRCRGDKL